MYLSIDIGDTFTRVGVSEDGQNFGGKDRYPTPQDYQDGITQAVNSVHRLTQILPAKIVTGFPGTFDRQTGQIKTAPHLITWVGHNPVQDLQTNLVGCVVLLENDASLAALAEAERGAGLGFNIVVYITLSTGVNAAKVIGGKLDPATQDAEAGHWNLSDGQEFESVASGTAFAKINGIKPEQCLDPYLWDQHAKRTSQGVAEIIDQWKPDIVVLGGSLILAGARFLDPLIRYTVEAFNTPICPIKLSSLGDDNVLIGGLILEQSTK